MAQVIYDIKKTHSGFSTVATYIFLSGGPGHGAVVGLDRGALDDAMVDQVAMVEPAAMEAMVDFVGQKTMAGQKHGSLSWP